jgi:hypothetical protein
MRWNLGIGLLPQRWLASGDGGQVEDPGRECR